MVIALVQDAQARLRAAVRRLAKAMTDRDDLIVEMRGGGATLNEIAQESGMSIEGVRKVLHRRGAT